MIIFTNRLLGYQSTSRRQHFNATRLQYVQNALVSKVD